MLSRDGAVSLVLATALTAAALATAVAEIPALSIFLGMVTVPVALYAALATRPIAMAVALADACAGVGVIVYSIYALIAALQTAR